MDNSSSWKDDTVSVNTRLAELMVLRASHSMPLSDVFFSSVSGGYFKGHGQQYARSSGEMCVGVLAFGFT